MGTSTFRGVGALLLGVFLVSIVAFSLPDMVPGDPAAVIAGEGATDQKLERIREENNFDDSVVSRYRQWVTSSAQGEFGRSGSDGQPIGTALAERWTVTAQLVVMAHLFSVGLGVLIAIACSVRIGSRLDAAANIVTMVLVSTPAFLCGMGLVWLLALQFDLFPVSGFERLSDGVGMNLEHAVLPALALALPEVGAYTQVLRADLSALMQADFIMAARGRGLTTRHIVFRQALRPASIATSILTSTHFARIVGMTMIVEPLFGIGGVGTFVAQAVPNRDIPVLQAALLVIGIVCLTMNMVTDAALRFLDPRMRPR